MKPAAAVIECVLSNHRAEDVVVQLVQTPKPRWIKPPAEIPCVTGDYSGAMLTPRTCIGPGGQLTFDDANEWFSIRLTLQAIPVEDRGWKVLRSIADVLVEEQVWLMASHNRFMCEFSLEPSIPPALLLVTAEKLDDKDCIVYVHHADRRPR